MWVVGNWPQKNLVFEKMIKGKYTDYYNFDSEKVDELLRSENVNDKLDGLFIYNTGKWWLWTER